MIVGDPAAAKPLVAGSMARDPNATLTRVPMKPLQLHFHARSEHLVGGRAYPIEMHVVSVVTNATAPGCPASPGCLAVVGVLFELAAEGEATASTAELAKIFDALPTTEGVRLQGPPCGGAQREGEGHRGGGRQKGRGRAAGRRAPACPVDSAAGCLVAPTLTHGTKRNTTRTTRNARMQTASRMTVTSLDLGKLLPADHTYVTYA